MKPKRPSGPGPHRLQHGSADDALPQPHFDTIKRTYEARAHAIAYLGVPGDWPELYVLGRALECRIDVYWPVEDAPTLGRYVLGANPKPRLRLCLLRESGAWSPLIGDVPDLDCLSAQWALDAATSVPDGPDALFDALATLYLLSPPPHAVEPSTRALRACAADKLREEARLPYAARDPALMHMLALMPETE